MFSRGHHSYVIRYLRLSCVISYQAHGHVLLSRVLSCLSVSCPAFHCPVLPFTVSAPSKCPVNNCPVLQKCPVLPSVLSCSVLSVLSVLSSVLSVLSSVLPYPVFSLIQRSGKEKSSQCPFISVFCPLSVLSSQCSVLPCSVSCPALLSVLPSVLSCPVSCPALCPVLPSAQPCPG